MRVVCAFKRPIEIIWSWRLTFVTVFTKAPLGGKSRFWVLYMIWMCSSSSLQRTLLCFGSWFGFCDIGYGIYCRPQCIFGHWIFSTTERISSSLSRICSADNSKTDYSKTRKSRFSPPWRKCLKPAFWKYLPKISTNGLLLRLRETNITVAAVFQRGTTPYNTHKES